MKRIAAILLGMALTVSTVEASPTAGFVDYDYMDTGYENPTQFIFENYVDWESLPIEEEPPKEPETIELTWEEYLVAQMAMREARGEGELGIRLVVDVVLNRRDSDQFPNDIYSVLNQANQFEDKNTYKRIENLNFALDDDVIRWIREEFTGPRTNYDVLYFSSGGYNAYCQPLFQHGNHYFGR